MSDNNFEDVRLSATNVFVVEILVDFEGCPNGIDPKEFKKGEIIEVNKPFYDVLINSKKAKDYKPTQPKENKKIQPTENK